MRYLIVPVPLTLVVLKETPGPHFVQRLFFLINISLSIMYLVMYLYMLRILAANVVSKILAHVVILKFEMK